MAGKVKPASGIGPARSLGGSSPRGLNTPEGFNKAEGVFKAGQRNGTVVNSVAALGNGGNTALPWDSTAAARDETARLTGKSTREQVNANRTIGEAEYGIDPGYDDFKNNPFSQAALLQHNHESNQRGILTTAGQAGYSGQTGNAQGAETGRTNQAHVGIVNEANRSKANWLAEEQASIHAEENAHNEDQEGAIERANAGEHPEVPLGNGGNGGGQQKEKIPYPAPPKKKWEWNGSHWHLVKA